MAVSWFYDTEIRNEQRDNLARWNLQDGMKPPEEHFCSVRQQVPDQPDWGKDVERLRGDVGSGRRRDLKRRLSIIGTRFSCEMKHGGRVEQLG